MNQKNLTYWVVGVCLAIIGTFLLFNDVVSNVFFSVVFGAFLVIFPFYVGTPIRKGLIPYIDSLSKEPEKNSRSEYGSRVEDFPVSVRILVWFTFGLGLSLLWTWLIPTILSLPIGLNSLALKMGWKTLAATDGVWQYGWALIFLAKYLVATGFSAVLAGNPFGYPSRKEN